MRPSIQPQGARESLVLPRNPSIEGREGPRREGGEARPPRRVLRPPIAGSSHGQSLGDSHTTQPPTRAMKGQQ